MLALRPPVAGIYAGPGGFMAIRYTMPYPLYPNIETLLTPNTLTTVTGHSIRHVSRTPLNATYNKSGSQLDSIDTNTGNGPRFILKRVSVDRDWQMRTTNDHSCRSAALWQYGILDRLPPEIDHTVVACAHDEPGWAILMRDVSQYMLPYAPIRAHHHQIFLEAMAALHATFFNDPLPADPRLNLCNLGHVYTVMGPETGRRELDRTDDVPKRMLEGWEAVKSTLPADVANLTLDLAHNPQPLCDALARTPHTLAHGDWRHANMGLIQAEPTRTILLDWQLATHAPPGIDLARHLGANSALLPASKEETIAGYRQQLAARLGDQFDESWWQPQLALSLLGGFVQDGWAIVLKATTWHITAHQRPHWQADLHWWIEQVRAGVKWL